MATVYSVMGPGGGPMKSPYGSFVKPPPPANSLMLTDNSDGNLQLPINCVLAGQQPEPLKKSLAQPLSGLTGTFKKIFRE
jgi:hypothetical protein